MSEEDLQRQRARLVRLFHLRALSWDPDVRIFRTSEASIADAVEQICGEKLERAMGGGDWRGTVTGHIYDACSPGPSKYFVTEKQVAAFRDQLISHTMHKVGIRVVPVDLRNRDLTPAQLRRVEEIVAALPPAAKRKVLLVLDAAD